MAAGCHFQCLLSPKAELMRPQEMGTHWKMLLKRAEYLFLEVYKNRSDFSSVEMQRVFKMD